MKHAPPQPPPAPRESFAPVRPGKGVRPLRLYRTVSAVSGGEVDIRAVDAEGNLVGETATVRVIDS